MLIAEKFLNDKIGKIDFPLPEQNGYIGYEIYSKNKRSINFINIKGTSFKSNFVRFNFTFHTLDIDFDIKKNQLSSRNIEIDYSNYVETFFEIKNKIILSEKFNIPEDKEKLFVLIWKSFVINKENWFVENVENIPRYLYDTIDDSIETNIKIAYINKFLEYIKNFDFLFYTEWEKHVNNGDCQHFLNWFHGFIMYGE